LLGWILQAGAVTPLPVKPAPPPSVPMKRVPADTIRLPKLPPDIAILASDITITPATPLVRNDNIGGQPWRIEAVIRNLGGSPASTVYFGCTVIGAPPPGLMVATETIPSIEPNGSVRISKSIPGHLLAPGEYRLQFSAHESGGREDSNHANNIVTVPLRLIGPDWSIVNADVEISPSNPRVGEPYRFSFVIRNTGTGPGLTAVTLGMYESSGAVVGSDAVFGTREIPAGGFELVELRPTAMREGVFDYRIWLDKGNHQKEVNELDNFASKVFRVVP
jgi:hypothetical protein